MYKGPAVNATGLIRYFKCNQSVTGQLVNSVSAQPAGTCTGGTFVSSPVQFSPNGLHFDGVDDYVEAPANPAFDLPVATMECWMKPTANVPGENALVGIRGTGVTRISAHVNVSLNHIGIWNGSAYETIPFSFTIGQWYHMAFVVNSATTDVYVNGSFAGTIAAGMGSTMNLPFRIGSAEPDMEFFTGVIDEVRLWNYNRSSSEIQAYMNTELNPENATEVNGLIAYYTFDQGIADGNNDAMTTVVDQVSNNTATLVNLALTGTSSNYVAQNPVMSVLPIKLNSFDLVKNNSNVILKWTIDLAEKGSFIIERSTNGQTFESIGNVYADGYQRSFVFSDEKPVEGKNYYRLKFEPHNGKIIYSDIKFINLEKADNYFKLVRVNGTSITVQTNKSTSIVIMSSSGEVLLRKKIIEGVHTIELGNVSKGIYFLHSPGYSGKLIIK